MRQRYIIHATAIHYTCDSDTFYMDSDWSVRSEMPPINVEKRCLIYTQICDTSPRNEYTAPPYTPYHTSVHEYGILGRGLKF